MITKEVDEFDSIMRDLEKNETILQMKNYRQHYDTDCYEHCRNVAHYTYLMCKKLNLDYISGIRASMLHDLFLYDWRVKSKQCPRLHGFRHPKISLRNAEKLFDLNNKEKDMILKHMWPLTVRLPKYKESYIIGIADKIATYYETKDYYKSKFSMKKLFRYSYMFLCLLIIKIF